MSVHDELIGANVRRLRDAAGMSQAELAKALGDQGISGIHPQTITKLEAGKRSFKFDEAIALANVFGVPVQNLALLASWETELLLGLQQRVVQLEVHRRRLHSQLEERRAEARQIDKAITDLEGQLAQANAELAEAQAELGAFRDGEDDS